MLRVRPGSRVPVALVIASLLLQFFAFASPAPASADDGRSKLDKESRERVAEAAGSGTANVTLLIATEDLASPSVVAALQALGATIRYHDGEVGYIRAIVPTAKADRAAKLAGIRAVEVDAVIPLPSPRPEAEGDELQIDPPGPATPAQNSYMPTREIGAPQFVAANPTFDGRDVTIGILDTGVDLDHPALLTTSTGERKVVEWVTFTHPTDDNDPTWLIADTIVEVGASGTFSVGTTTYTGAPQGTFRFAVFNEGDPRFGGEGSEYRVACGGDLNRNGVCNEKFAVLWDGEDTVIVDTNADRSFAGESAMRPYKENFDIGHFGTDNPATAVRESVPFVVQVDRAFNAVNIGIVSGAHGTHVAGIAAGNGFFNGAYDGAAPGAKIVSVRVCLFVSGCTAHALIEGMIFAIKEAGSDVVNMSIGGLPALNDGNNPRAVIYNNLIDKRNAQMFISAGNSGPGINTVGDPSVATRVMSVGASWSKESVLSNYGATAVSDMALHDFSSRGPREDGFTKPQIVAPGNAVSSIPLWQPGGCIPYACPPGFALFNGTSMAAPQATGGAALLLSAAKQSDVSRKAAQLRQAIMSSAEAIPVYKRHEQGSGLMNVGAAWSLLSAGIKTHDIVSAVPTNTILSPLLATPGIGTGIYERENVFTGQSKTRTYTFTKLDGGKGTFNVSLVGDAAFTAGASQVTLSKGGSATLPVTFNAQATPGVYSALLRLDDPATVGIDYQIMNTVVVSSNLGASPFTATRSGSAKRFEASAQKFFFQVAPGTSAVRFSVSRTNAGNAGRIRFTCIDPRGIPLNACSAGLFGPPVPPATATPTTVTRTVANPRPGSWEIAVIASRAAGPAESTFDVTATAFKVSFSPASWTRNGTIASVPASQDFRITNEFASATIGATGGTFASAFALTATILTGDAPHLRSFTVPAGSSSLTVATTQGSDPAADLDLFVFHCPSGTFGAGCTLKGSGLGATTAETVTVPLPPSGTWFSLVEVFDIPLGTTTYGYSDAVTNTAFGSIAITSGAGFVNRLSGSFFDVTATGTPGAPGAGRFLRGAVQGRLGNEDGAVLGSAPVTFNFAP